WKRQRKLSAPAFSPKRLETYGQIMVDHTYAMLERWQSGKTLDIQHEMMQLTLGIATKTLFDVDLPAGDKALEEALTSAQRHLYTRMNSPLLLMLPEWIPLPTNVEMHKAIDTVDKVVYRLIEERKGKSEGRNDLLSILLSVRDDDGSGMSDRQIR